MNRLLALLLFWPLSALALPRLELDVRLDPATRQFDATATVTDDEGLIAFSLAPGFEITSAAADGKPTKLAGLQGQYRLPARSKRLDIAYRGTLKPLAALDHREVLADRTPVAAPEGSFLPAASRWYPDVGQRFSYRVELKLPTGQKGLVEGDLLNETDTSDGYRAEYEFPHPADGIHLMAGPYVVDERLLTLAADHGIRVRTWFHADLAHLSKGYLDDSARYLERYAKLIGSYPFGMFSIVASPTPTGFGMSSLTYLGRDVIRLPFIRATSLGHEVLHNWWGNGVYPDWDQGNWSEGLTTFLADYAYKEDEGEDAAREMRLSWLRDLAAVPPGQDTALRDFRSRHHGIASIVGYNKSAMAFLMLRDAIGDAAFARGLRLLWERKRFQTARWSDLEAAFSDAAGRPLADFFRQWVDRPGAPEIRLKAATQTGDMLTLHFARPVGYQLGVSLRLTMGDGTEVRAIQLHEGDATATLKVQGEVRSIELDPDYRLWRRVDAALLPPILRETFVAPKATLIVTDAAAELRSAALALSAKLLDAEPVVADALPGTGAALIIGGTASVDSWLARHGLPARPDAVATRGSAQVWAGRDSQNSRPYAVVSARGAASLKALERGLPHYGKQSWLVFEGGRASDKAVWPPYAAPVTVKQVGVQ